MNLQNVNYHFSQNKNYMLFLHTTNEQPISSTIYIKKTITDVIPSYLSKIDTLHINDECYIGYEFKKKCADCLKFAEQLIYKTKAKDFVAHPKNTKPIFKVGNNAAQIFGVDNYEASSEYANKYRGKINERVNPDINEAFAIVEQNLTVAQSTYGIDNLLEMANVFLGVTDCEYKKEYYDLIIAVFNTFKKRVDGKEINDAIFDFVTVKDNEYNITQPTLDILYDLADEIRIAVHKENKFYYPYHIGTVLFKDGNDNITLEVCGNDTMQPIFTMYARL